ncbi:MAG: hypothetical protein Q8P95_00320 [bacterium]|nr:hypothetical protein [bacterium]
MDSFGITDPEFAKLVCEELLLMVQDGDNSDSDFDTAVRTYGDALHSELMFGDMDPFEHPFLSRVLRRCFQMGARDSVAQLQTEVRLRVGMFFVFEGNHYVELIFREIFELFREISDVIRSTQGEQRSSIAETLCKVSLQKSALERTRCVDASDPSRVAYEWRVMRAYLGRHIVKSEATQLLPGGAESRSWFYRHMPRILAEHAKARVVPRRIRYREELTREQVIAAVRYRTGGMKRAKIAEIFGVEAGPYFTQYLSLQVRNVIFPKFPDWFASANAPDVRKREGLFSGPKPEHTEPLQRFLRAEISRDTLRQALGLPDASDPVLDIAITAIKKANMPDLLGKRRPKSGLSDEAKLAIVSEYDLLVAANKGKKGAADDGVYDELMKRARVKSNISMRSTMTAWRKRLRGRGLYPSQK